MTTIKLSEAKAHLGDYASRAARGETFLISNHNRPVAQLIAPPDDKLGVRPILGLLRGKAIIPDDFDEPIPEFEKDFYGE